MALTKARQTKLTAPALRPAVISTRAEITSLEDACFALVASLPVTVEVLGDKVVVSDEQINMYGAGTTLNAALADYRASLIEYLQWLESNEATLASHLLEHLDWLRRRLRRAGSA